MKLTLFGKKPSPEEIEREVTDEIEALVRSSEKPPPPEWTLVGGLPAEEPVAADTPVTAEVVEEVEEAEQVEEGSVAPPPPAPVAAKRARSGASGAAAKRAGARAARAASGGRSSKS